MSRYWTLFLSIGSVFGFFELASWASPASCVGPQLLNASFTARQFGLRIDGQTIMTKAGEKLYIRTHLMDEGSVFFDVLDKNGRKVAHGYRRIQKGEIGGGGTYVAGENERSYISYSLDTVLQKDLEKNLPSLSRVFQFEYEIDYPTRQIKAIHLMTQTGDLEGSFYFEKGKLQRSAPKDKGIEPFFQLRDFFEQKSLDLQNEAFLRAQVPATFRELERGRDMGGQGIGSALFSKFAELVPRFTDLTAEVNNRETVRLLNQKAARLMKSQEYLSLSSDEQRDWLQRQLVAVARQSKVGHVLEKSGWHIQDVQGDPDGSFFYLRCFKK